MASMWRLKGILWEFFLAFHHVNPCDHKSYSLAESIFSCWAILLLLLEKMCGQNLMTLSGRLNFSDATLYI